MKRIDFLILKKRLSKPIMQEWIVTKKDEKIDEVQIRILKEAEKKAERIKMRYTVKGELKMPKKFQKSKMFD